jgi:hypothetical protein
LHDATPTPTKKTKTMIAAFNTDTQLLQNYREHRAANNPTGMGCVRLYSNGSITSGMSEIARFENAKDAAKALKAAGYRKGDGDKHSTVYYV